MKKITIALGALLITLPSHSAISVGDLHPLIKEWCKKNPDCLECKQFQKFIFCAQKRPLPWEVAFAKKNDDTKTLSTELFCQEKPWTEKQWPVRTKEGKYVTFDNIYNEVRDILQKQDGFLSFEEKKALEITEIIGKKLEQLSSEKIYSDSDLKKALSYLPKEISKLCASQVHNRNCGHVIAVFKNPTHYHSAQLAELVIKIGEDQKWSGDQVIDYISQVHEAFAKRRSEVITNFLLKVAHQLPDDETKQINKELSKKTTTIQKTAESLGKVFHYLLDGDVTKAYYVFKKEYK